MGLGGRGDSETEEKGRRNNVAEERERECHRKNSLEIGRGRKTRDPKPLGPTIQPSARRNKPRPNNKVQPSPPQPKPYSSHNQNSRPESDPPNSPRA